MGRSQLAKTVETDGDETDRGSSQLILCQQGMAAVQCGIRVGPPSRPQACSGTRKRGQRRAVISTGQECPVEPKDCVYPRQKGKLRHEAN